MLTVSKRGQFWCTFIRDWSFLYSKHSYFCYFQCLGLHWKWTFDTWDETWATLKYRPRESHAPDQFYFDHVEAVGVYLQCLSSVWGLSKPLQQRGVQLLSILPKPTSLIHCCTSGLWHSQIFISAPWQICLTWPDMSQQCITAAKKKEMESWAASAEMVLAEMEEMW